MMKRVNGFVFSLAVLTVVGFILFVSGASFAACPDGITAYWKLDDTGGSTYTDFIGGHNGYVDTGAGLVAPTAVPDEGINGAQAFDTTTGIDVAASKTFNWSATDSFSIEFWTKTDGKLAPATNQVIIGRGAASPDIFWWVGARQTDGDADLYMRDGDGHSVSIVGTASLTDGAWHYVVVTRDGTTDEISLYVDGVLQGSDTQAFTGFSAPDNLQIGYLDGTYHFVGLIDEVALYNRVLDLTNDILPHLNDKSDYCGGSAAPGDAPFPTGTAALWPLNEAAGSTDFLDVVGGHDGYVDTGAGLVAPTAAPAEGINGAQAFGATTGIDVAAASTFNWSATDSFSIEFWTKTDGKVAPGTNQVIIGRGAASPDIFWWVGARQTDGDADLYLRDGDGHSVSIVGPASLTDGAWHYVVVTRDGTTDENSLYVDNVLQGSVTQAFTGLYAPDNLQIGYLDGKYHFVGLIDEVALYDRVLDLTNDMVPHYDAGVAGSDVQTLRPAPTADAGSDQTVVQGATVTLKGSGTPGYDGTTPLAYQWQQDAGDAHQVTLSDANVAQPTFVAPTVDKNGAVLNFTLTVTATDGQSSTDSVFVNVANGNAPVANAGKDQSVTEGDTVTLDGSGSTDADGTITTYLWQQLSGTTVTIKNANQAKATFTAPQVDSNGETLKFKLTVTDNDGLTSSGTVDINVSDASSSKPTSSGGGGGGGCFIGSLY